MEDLQGDSCWGIPTPGPEAEFRPRLPHPGEKLTCDQKKNQQNLLQQIWSKIEVCKFVLMSHARFTKNKSENSEMQINN